VPLWRLVIVRFPQTVGQALEPRANGWLLRQRRLTRLVTFLLLPFLDSTNPG
jgi:hypothetical protein